MHDSLPFVAAAALVVASDLAAQTAQPVPYHANLVDCHESTALPFGVPGFRTQILIDGSAVAPTGAALLGIRFRSDRPSLPLPGHSVPNVTVRVGETTAVVPQMDTTFANNVTGPMTTVFQGTVVVPGNPVGHSGPAPWDIEVPFVVPVPFSPANGSLLIEIVADNPAGGSPRHWLDAALPGGSVTQYGQPGDNPSGDFLNLIVSSGGDLDPRRLSLNNPIEFSSTTFFTSPPGFLALGLAPTPGAIDLGFLGATNQYLHIDPLLFAPHAWTGTFIGWASTFTIAVPNDPSWIDDVLYGQSLLLEPTANPFGIVLSHAVEVRVGDNTQAFLPMQQLDATDPLATTGTLLDFGFGGSVDYGAVPVLLEGVFF